MENIEILAKFHELNYQEQTHAVERQSHFANAGIVPLAQQVHRATSRLGLSTRQALCRVEVLQGTALCPVPLAQNS